jgi:hypothetical protein
MLILPYALPRPTAAEAHLFPIQVRRAPKSSILKTLAGLIGPRRVEVQPRPTINRTHGCAPMVSTPGTSRTKLRELSFNNLTKHQPRPFGVHARSGPMVGVPGKDRRGTIELFREDDAGETVRQRHRTERKLELSACERAVPVSVRAADQECDVAATFVAPPSEPAGECVAAKRFAAAVQHDEQIRPRGMLQQPGRFVGAPLGSSGLTSLGKFGKRERAERNAPAGLIDPLCIFEIKLSLGTILETSHGDN